MLRLLSLLALLLLVASGTPQAAAQSPGIGEGYDGTFAITNAQIETVTNGTIENGTVVIEDGRITAVGAGVSVPAGAEVIDATGHTVYPGMIDGGTRMGLQEIGAVPVTVDVNEIGDVTPQMQAITAVNPSSSVFPITRVNGVLAALTAQGGGLIPGYAAVIKLHGYSAEHMDTGFRGLVLNFPSTARRGPFDRRSIEDIRRQGEEALETLNEVWEQARLYHRLDSARTAARASAPLPYQPEMAAMLPAIRREAPVLVEVDAAADIVAALEWIAEQNVDAILTGVAEGWRVADQIAAAGVPVIAGPVLSLPTRQSDNYARPYQNPGLMAQAGVTVALRTAEIENVRNLPYNAGYAAAYGMGREAALAAVTIVPARLFGIDDDLGSIEVGKSATLFIADGDPFEPMTSIRHVFIDGYRIPMESRQTQLFDEYLDRRPGVIK